MPTPDVPNVPPPPSEYQQRGPGVWSGVKIFFGGCIVLPILLFALFFGLTMCGAFVSGLTGG